MLLLFFVFIFVFNTNNEYSSAGLGTKTGFQHLIPLAGDLAPSPSTTEGRGLTSLKLVLANLSLSNPLLYGLERFSAIQFHDWLRYDLIHNWSAVQYAGPCSLPPQGVGSVHHRHLDPLGFINSWVTVFLLSPTTYHQRLLEMPWDLPALNSP